MAKNVPKITDVGMFLHILSAPYRLPSGRVTSIKVRNEENVKQMTNAHISKTETRYQNFNYIFEISSEFYI